MRALLLALLLLPGLAHAACRPGFRLALDVGHTLSQPGATSASGSSEFLYNRRLAQTVADTLARAAVSTALIGLEGTPLRLDDRPRQAQAAGATLFLSLHHDSVQPQYLSTWQVDNRPVAYSDRFRGYALFVSSTGPRFDASLRFATELGRALQSAGLTPSLYHAEPIPHENRPLLDPALGIHRFDELLVLRATAMPAVLLEAGVIVNRAEEAQLRTQAQRQRIADAVAAAVLRSCSP